LEEMDLIKIEGKSMLSKILAKLRCNEAEIPTFKEITEEVEWVRQQRYEAKMQNHY
jgi:hypothetical protein